VKQSQEKLNQGEAEGTESPQANSKYEIRSTKWFDKLTTLSQIEGQIQNPNSQMFKTKLLTENCPLFWSFGFLKFEFA